MFFRLVRLERYRNRIAYLYFFSNIPGIVRRSTAQASFGVMSIFFFGIVKHIYDYRKLRESAQQLRIEKQEAELNYLKSQTNPHFLFNTLNNIYSLGKR